MFPFDIDSMSELMPFSFLSQLLNAFCEDNCGTKTTRARVLFLRVELNTRSFVKYSISFNIEFSCNSVCGCEKSVDIPNCDKTGYFGLNVIIRGELIVFSLFNGISVRLEHSS